MKSLTASSGDTRGFSLRRDWPRAETGDKAQGRDQISIFRIWIIRIWEIERK